METKTRAKVILKKVEERQGARTEIYEHPSEPGASIEVIHRRGWSYRLVGAGSDGKWKPWPDGYITKKEVLAEIEGKVL
jgi:hypothetical protein